MMAVGLVPEMMFLVDYISRALGKGGGLGAAAWVAYGVGAMAGPVLYGLAADRWGARAAIRLALAAQVVAVLDQWLCLFGGLRPDRRPTPGALRTGRRRVADRLRARCARAGRAPSAGRGPLGSLSTADTLAHDPAVCLFFQRSPCFNV